MHQDAHANINMQRQNCSEFSVGLPFTEARCSSTCCCVLWGNTGRMLRTSGSSKGPAWSHRPTQYSSELLARDDVLRPRASCSSTRPAFCQMQAAQVRWKQDLCRSQVPISICNTQQSIWVHLSKDLTHCVEFAGSWPWVAELGLCRPLMMAGSDQARNAALEEARAATCAMTCQSHCFALNLL